MILFKTSLLAFLLVNCSLLIQGKPLSPEVNNSPNLELKSDLRDALLSCVTKLYPESHEAYNVCSDYMRKFVYDDVTTLALCSNLLKMSAEDIAKCAKNTEESKRPEAQVSKIIKDEDQPEGPAKKVYIELYMEVLCPYCYAFIRNQMRANYENLRQIADFDVIPYGNARTYTTPEGRHYFTCQHGPGECYGNTISSCAKKHLPSHDAFLDFVMCFNEVQPTHDRDFNAFIKKCAPKEYDTLFNCAQSLEGDELLYIQGEKTHALSPPHKWVPWLTFDHVHTPDMDSEPIENLLAYTCKKYKGERPSFC